MLWRKPRLQGFTLTELILVLIVLAVTLGMVLPSIIRVRAASRVRVCQNNLKQIGISLFLFADNDAKGRLCSGAFDPARDGCSDTWGWVADMVKGGLGLPNEFKCPANPLTGCEKLNDLFGFSTTDNLNKLVGNLSFRIEDGICGSDHWNGISGTGSSGKYANTDEFSAERASLISRYFIQQGYNTNYAASWYLTRTGPRIRYRPADQTIRTNGQAAQQGLKGLRETLGPLSTNRIENSIFSSSVIPLLGDAALGDIDEAIARTDFKLTPTDVFARGSKDQETYLHLGDLLCESISNGPAYYNRSTKSIKRIGSYNSRLDVQLNYERNSHRMPPTGSPGNHLYLVDTRQWSSWHGVGQRKLCNILFSDGSVRSMLDPNRDGFLNPGFPVPSDFKQSDYLELGFKDNLVELSEREAISFVFLNPYSIKQILD